MGAEISLSADIANYLDGRTPEVVESELYEIWNHLDTNQSGTLDTKESRQFFDMVFVVLRDRGVQIPNADKAAAELMNHFDQDHNGEISWQEFQDAVYNLFPEEEAGAEEEVYYDEGERPPKDPAEIAAKLEKEKQARWIRSHVKFGGSSEDGDMFDHYEENSQIERIKKIVFRVKDQLECFQVIYELTDGTEWSTPLYGAPLETLVTPNPNYNEEQLTEMEQKNWVEIDINPDNEYITSLEGRSSEETVNGLTFEVSHKYPNGAIRQRVLGKKGTGVSSRFSLHGNLHLVGFYGNYTTAGVHRLGFYYKKEVFLNGKTKKYETWKEAIDGRQISYYYKKYFGKPGFAPPKLVEAGGDESDRSVNIVLDGLKDLLTPEDQQQLIENQLFTEKDLEDDLFLTYDKFDKVVVFQTKDPLDPAILAATGAESADQLEPGMEYIIAEKGTDVANLFGYMTQVLAAIVEESIGWPVKCVKIVFATDWRHNAFSIKRSKKETSAKVFLVESARSSEEQAILADIADNDDIKEIFESKYQEVKNLASGEWKAKVAEYHSVKANLDPAQKEEYKKIFKGYKREVHDTLQLVDFKYTLYHDRWAKLSAYKDFTFNNIHEYQESLAKATDEEITKELLGRGERDMTFFTNFLNGLADYFNQTKNIRELVEQKLQLDDDFYFYPLNMTRYFDVKEHHNHEKVHIKIGPLKTYDRGLQKVIETKDKTGALLDVLRATILCKDPVVPLLVIEYLNDQGMLTRVKNKTGPFEEYKCVHINFTVPAKFRTIYELQIVFEEYYELQKMDHDYYEIIRVM